MDELAFIDTSETINADLSESFLRMDEVIASRIAARRATKKFSDFIEKKAEETVVDSTKEVVKKKTKDAAKKAGKKVTKAVAEKAVKKAATETAKKTTQTIATETAKDAAAIIATSSSTAVGATAGSAAGTVGGPYGMLIGLAAGTAVGKSAEVGIGIADNHFKRSRTRKQAMKDAFMQDRNPGIMKNSGKRFLTELMAYGRDLKNITSLILPGFFMGLAATAIFLVFSLVILFVVVGCISLFVKQTNRETIGQLAGGQEVVYFCQYEEPYASYPYGDSTIRVCGCGPTTVAMVVSTLTETTVDPREVSDFAMEHGYYLDHIGTKHGLFYEYGLQTTDCGQDLMTALGVIPDGGMVILSVSGSNDLYRGAGHILAIRGITEDGKILVADPASRNNTESEWDYETIQEILVKCYSVTYDNSEP